MFVIKAMSKIHVKGYGGKVYGEFGVRGIGFLWVWGFEGPGSMGILFVRVIRNLSERT